VPLTRIGRVTVGRSRVRLLDACGDEIATSRGGFDHFR
jgi:hypothetical protein